MVNPNDTLPSECRTEENMDKVETKHPATKLVDNFGKSQRTLYRFQVVMLVVIVGGVMFAANWLFNSSNPINPINHLSLFQEGVLILLVLILVSLNRNKS